MICCKFAINKRVKNRANIVIPFTCRETNLKEVTGGFHSSFF